MPTNVSVYPNPFDGALSLEVIVEASKETVVSMINQQQKIIKLLNWNLHRGTNKTTLEDLGELPSGNYYVEIKNMEGKNLFRTKLVKV